MTFQDTSQEFSMKRRGFRKLFLNLGILLIASALHFFLQLMLGSYIADRAITNLPRTTHVSLLVLVFVFFGTIVSLFLHSRRIWQNYRERVLVSFIVTVIFSLIPILFFRMPYSSVFLFWGFNLQILLTILVTLIFERSNKSIVGLTKQTMIEIKHLISSDNTRTISPTVSEIGELDLIVLKESELNSSEWSSFLMNCIARSVTVEEQVNFMERLSGKVDLDHLSFRRSQQLFRKNGYLPIKRLIDLLFSACLLIVLMPLMMLIAILIRFESPGTALFFQERVGLGGRSFTIYKFRTMQNADGSSKAKFTDKYDARVTRIGKVLRKFRIDELPQLWNVMIGEMSLIGPRPEQLDLIDSIQKDIPLFSLRHYLRPGITGWAQVRHGYADDISTTREKLAYDLWYVSNVSILVDISIAFRTLRVILTGFGSR